MNTGGLIMRLYIRLMKTQIRRYHWLTLGISAGIIFLLITLAILGYCGVFKWMRKRYSKKQPWMEKVATSQESETASLISDREAQPNYHFYQPVIQPRQTASV